MKAEEASPIIKSKYNLRGVMESYGLHVPDRDGEFKIKCPFHDDSTPSFSVDLSKGLFNCFGCKKAGDLISFVAFKENCTPYDAMKKLEPGLFEEKKKGPRGRVTATYIYKDEDGAEIFRKLRYENKDFIQGRMVEGKFVAGLNGARRVLYRLPELLSSKSPVWIVEGEKDADNLAALGFITTTNPEGGGNWKPEYTQILRNRNLILCGDNDPTGEKHTKLLRETLSPVCRSLKQVKIPSPHKDVSDFIDSIPEPLDAQEALSEIESKTALFCDHSASFLPDIDDAFALCETVISDPPELVTGLLHQGTKLSLGGGSKTNKTWVLLDMALCISHGVPWLEFEVHQSPVLFLNMEIHRTFFRRRVLKVATERGIELQKGLLDIWNLRGFSAPYTDLIPKIQEGIKKKNYGLIVLDPIYKLYGELDENKAGDISKLMNELERLAFQSNTAIAFAAHFSKGNQSQKDAMDRISGSGVFGRDPDSVLTMTAHEEPDAFSIETKLRNFPPCNPFVVKWKYPVMNRDASLDPANLKNPKGKKSQGKGTPEDILKLIPEDRDISQKVLLSKAQTKGMGLNRARGFIAELIAEKRLVEILTKVPKKRATPSYALPGINLNSREDCKDREDCEEGV